MIPAVTDARALEMLEDRIRTLLGARRYADAEAAAGHALQTNPDSVVLRRLRSEALAGQERYDEALADAEAACRLDPHDATALRNLSYRCMGVGDRPAALAAAGRALALEPHAWTSHYTRAFALATGGETSDPSALGEALETIDEAARIAPDNPNVMHLRGLVLARLGRKDTARTSYEQALAANPHHTGALTGLANLDLPMKPLLAAERITSVAGLDPQSRVFRANTHAMLGGLAIMYTGGGLIGTGLVVAMTRVLGAPRWAWWVVTLTLLVLLACGWWGLSGSTFRGLDSSPRAVWRALKRRQRRAMVKNLLVGAASLAFGLAPLPVRFTASVLVLVILGLILKRVRRRPPRVA
jgi:Flp pilus assembly protein TadD